jgi:hypothetical protein
LRKKSFPWLARSFQTNYKFAVNFGRVARHASGAIRALTLFRTFVKHQLVRKPCGNIFVRVGFSRKIIKVEGSTSEV